ncbi:toll/interleukin-1 receptor domain-containing protein, partial [Frankia sp. AvcI1]
SGGAVTERLTDIEVEMLARAFYRPSNAMAILERAGLERGRQPSWTTQTPLEFWDEINHYLHLGILADGRVNILAAAAAAYPANKVFTAATKPTGTAEGETAAAGSATAGTAAGGSAAGAGSPSVEAAPAAGPSGTGSEGVRAPAGSVLFAIDPVRFGPAGVGVPVAWRDGLRQLVGLAAQRCDLPADAVRVQDRGGGLLGVVRDDVPAERVVADLVRELGGMLHAYNRPRNDSGRVRLRVALHQGRAVADDTAAAPAASGAARGDTARGTTALRDAALRDAAQAASRLVDTPALSRLLGEFPTAEMGVIISGALFATAVDRRRQQRQRELDPDSFRRVETDVPGLTGPAWVQLPPADNRAAGDGAAGDPRVPEAEQQSVPPTAAPIVAEEPRTTAGWDFLVSAAEEDGAWGEWCAWLLEQQGFQVHLDTWDVVAGDHLVARLNEAVSHSKRTLVVLSENYLASAKVQAEWHAAWWADPTGMKRRLIPVRVAVCPPETQGLLRGISYIDLVNLDDETARRTFVEQIKRAIQGSYRPTTPPPFPGSPART